MCLANFIVDALRTSGETNENTQAIVQGQLDTKLNELGRQQADQLGRVYPVAKCDLIYSSDLKRARDTGEIMVKAAGCESTKTIFDDVRLRERHLGKFQGQSLQQLRTAAQDSGESVVLYTPPGGENHAHVRERIVDFINNRLLGDVQQLLCQKAEPKVLLVSHGGVIREMITYFATFGHATLVSPKVRIIPPNTSISDFRIKVRTDQPSKLSIESVECDVLHDISHLNEEVQKKALNQPQVNDNVAI